MNKTFQVALVLVLFAGVSQAVSAAEPAEACGQFVQKFYDWYLARDKALTNENSQKSVMEVALREKRSSFSPGLVKALQEDVAASEKSRLTKLLDLDSLIRFSTHRKRRKKYIVGQVRAK